MLYCPMNTIKYYRKMFIVFGSVTMHGIHENDIDDCDFEYNSNTHLINGIPWPMTV